MPESVHEAEVIRSLQDLTDPEIGRSLGSLGMLKGARVSDGSVEVHVDLPTPAYPDRNRLTEAITAALRQKLPQVSSARVTFTSDVRGKNTGGAIGLRVRNVIAVGSGKGGVGKSTIAASLAFGLKHYGARVGLMDADVYGPSIPHLLGVSGRPEMIEPQPGVVRIIPLESDGLKVLSIGFLVAPEQAVVWRGPMLHKLLTQFLKDTDWGDLDYLIIDLPPGTGDVSLTLSQLLGLAGAVVVCTPQQVALLDAVKAISMFNQVKIPVLGIVENMSGEIFGRGGARAKAGQMGIPFLGEVPIEAGIRVKGDAGRISELFSTENASRGPLLHVTERVAIEVAKSLLSTPSLPTLEIL
jgi:ATP-binding protein involved in chromosome partitioning